MASSYTENINGIEFLVGEINARKCKNINGLCKELEESFQSSIAEKQSCIDAMYDLAWCKEKNYKIIVNRFYTVDSKARKLITEELNSYKNYWNSIQVKEQDTNKNNFLVEYN